MVGTVVALIMLWPIICIVIIHVVRKKSRKPHNAFTTDVSMYASPAYGTHQVFSEPGMDHLYEPINELYEEKSKTLQDPPQADDDDEAAIDYIKMNPSFEAVDHVVTEEI